MPKSRPPYPPEFRRQVIELVRSGRTPEELARQFEPTAQSIRNWVEQADLDEGRRRCSGCTRLTMTCTWSCGLSRWWTTSAWCWSKPTSSHALNEKLLQAAIAAAMAAETPQWHATTTEPPLADVVRRPRQNQAALRNGEVAGEGVPSTARRAYQAGSLDLVDELVGRDGVHIGRIVELPIRSAKAVAHRAGGAPELFSEKVPAPFSFENVNSC